MGKLTPFGLAVRKALLERGVTAADMARELGFNENAVRDALRGVKPGIKYRKPIERYLGLDSSE
jgi:ribosome-binding protein aMBF1 (putative translation factor)